MVVREKRNPLAIIKKTADVRREKISSPEAAKEYYGFIDEEVRRLNRLVSDFYFLSREPEPQRSTFYLRRLLQEVVERFAAENVKFSLAGFEQPYSLAAMRPNFARRSSLFSSTPFRPRSGLS